MELVQTSVEKSFIVIYKGKEYYINYLNSDGQTLGLINRLNWEVIDEDQEELSPYIFGKTSKDNIKLRNKLIQFCIDNFNNYNPCYKTDY